MPSKNLVTGLAKLMIAAAWADGELETSEVNALKDLMFNFPDITDDDWLVFNMYMDAPVSPEEADGLFEIVLNEISSDADKEFVLSTITRMIEADGRVTPEEETLLEQITGAINEKRTGIFSLFGGLIGGAVKKRRNGYNRGIQRENMIDDYIKNSIYFSLKPVMDNEGMDSEISDGRLRTLCLAAGLMARVAWVDDELSDDEKLAMQTYLVDDWGLTVREAETVTEMSCSKVAKGLDFFRLSRSFYEATSKDERKAFLKSLFHIANSSGKTSHKEIEEIRLISEQLHLTHSDFIDAKLSVSDDDRKGL